MSNHKDANDPYKDLHPDQIIQVKGMEGAITQLTNIVSSFKAFKDFKLGDVYIEEEWSEWDVKKTWINQNHMGFPVKYKVVYVSPHGVPYLRQLNPNGRPTGPLRTPPHKSIVLIEAFKNMTHAKNFTYRFVPDPEALDAILLQEEFKPMAAHKDKLKLFNEISKHNKKVAIKTGWNGGHGHIATFFKGLKPGDKFWTSPGTAFVLQSLTKAGNEWCIKCMDQNAAIQTFNFSYFLHKRLYSAAPRSFKQESGT